MEGSDFRRRGVMPEEGSASSAVGEVENGGRLEVMGDKEEEAIDVGDV